jgi:hypothetical protein
LKGSARWKKCVSPVEEGGGPHGHVVGVVEHNGDDVELLDKEVGVVGQAIAQESHTITDLR